MAKEKRQIDVTENLPEHERVVVSVELPAVMEVRVAEGVAFKLYVHELTGPERAKAFESIVRYGIGRFTRDGCTKVREEVDGKTVERDATAEERLGLSTAKWQRLFSGRMRERTGGGDAILGELRTLTVAALVKSGVARKAIAKLPDRAACEKALAHLPGMYARKLAQAEKIAAMRMEE